MTAFNVVLLEGLFRAHADGFVVERDDGVIKPILPEIEKFHKQSVFLSMHHLPPMTIQRDRWCGGCCLWQPVDCPFGHHRTPLQLLNYTGQGVMTMGGEGNLYIDFFDGRREILPLRWMDGHIGRFVAATALSVEAMRDAVNASPVAMDVLGLTNQVSDLRDVLVRIQTVLKDEK